MAAAEAKRGHAVVAEQLKELLEQAKNPRPRVFSSGPIPVPAVRNDLTSILAVQNPKTLLSNMVLDDKLAAQRLKYQEEAVLSAKKMLEEYGGLFLSDVAGLGKTYMAALLAQQLNGRSLVIAPPHLLDKDNPGSWPNVFGDFRVPHTDFESLGKLEDLLQRDTSKYANVFIDESHRFRTETTQTYEMLAQMHPVLAGHLRTWHRQTLHAKPDDFVFPSIREQGRKPLYASSFVADYLRPAAQKAGVPIQDGQKFGLHNLRHSLSNWLVNKAKVAPKTVQGILRHAKIQTTLDLYTQEDSDETRAAQGQFLTAVGMNATVQ